jgi:hypothetical protein
MDWYHEFSVIAGPGKQQGKDLTWVGDKKADKKDGPHVDAAPGYSAWASPTASCTSVGGPVTVSPRSVLDRKQASLGTSEAEFFHGHSGFVRLGTHKCTSIRHLDMNARTWFHRWHLAGEHEDDSGSRAGRCGHVCWRS